jgi:hypothetical protein
VHDGDFIFSETWKPPDLPDNLLKFVMLLINYFIPTNALHCFSVFCPYTCFGTSCAIIRGAVESYKKLYVVKVNWMH